MKIIQISTYDIRGGAALSAYRLHCGLREIGHDSRMVVRYQDTADNSVVRMTPKPGRQNDDRGFSLDVVIQQHYINLNRTDISNTLFSLPYPGYDLCKLPMVQEADVINLHWVAQYQSPLTIHRLLSLGKPVVWTLHDQWPFTGGCHYTAGCEGYKAGCHGCPQLSDDRFGLPESVLKDKETFFRNAGLTIVAPSRWMADCARASRLFRDLRIETIPSSLETDVFAPIPKREAKERLGISPDVFTFLFGAEYVNEKRKGFGVLRVAIALCLRNPRFQDLVLRDRIQMICFGHLDDAPFSVGVPVISMGYVKSDAEVRLAYSAADVFVQASLEDNLPNTMLEAMSCATPVAAFDVGGMSDMVENGVTGWLAPPCDSQKLSEILLWFISHPDKCETMGRACRKKMENGYTLHAQSRAYHAVYEELAGSNRPSGRVPTGLKSGGLHQAASGNRGGPEVFSVPRENGVGRYFAGIYGQVLVKSLMAFAPEIYKRWQVSDLDRKARYDQVRELSNLLRECESDRGARLDQVRELTNLLRECELDRKARLDQLKELETAFLSRSTDRSNGDRRSQI